MSSAIYWPFCSSLIVLIWVDPNQLSIQVICLSSLALWDWLLHSPGLVVIELAVGYEAWYPLGWHHPLWLAGLNIDWECLGLQCIIGQCAWCQFLPFFKGHWQSPCTSQIAGKCLPLKLCKENVKISTYGDNPTHNASTGFYHIEAETKWPPFAYNIFTLIFFNENCCILIKISNHFSNQFSCQ